MTRQELQPASPVFEQASDWFLKLQNSADPQLLTEFQNWLDSDPDHEEAYLEVLSLWQELDQLTPDADEKTVASLDSDVAYGTGQEEKISLKTTGKPTYIKRFAQALALAACVALVAVLTPVHVWQPADYSTATAEQRIVELDDGSKLHLAAQSAVNVDYTASGRQIELLYGEVFFEVASDPRRPFRVQSENQMAQALGTAFNIRLLDNNIQTTLTEGTLKLDLDDQATVIINAGQRVEWDGTGKHRLLKGDYPYLPSWKRNIVRLDRMPLSDVVELLNRNYTPVFRIANPKLREEILQGTLPLNNLETVMKVLQGALNLEFTRVSDQLILIY